MVEDLSSDGENVPRLAVVYGAGEGERLESPGGSGKPGGMLCRMARFLLESEAVGLMRYCPGRPGPVVTNWRSRRAW